MGRGGRDRSRLLRGRDLAAAERALADGAGKDPTADPAPVGVRGGQPPGAGTRRTDPDGLLAGGFVVALVLAGFALLQRAQAEQNATLADQQRQVAEEQRAEAEANADLAFGRELAHAALERLDTDPESRSSSRSRASASRGPRRPTRPSAARCRARRCARSIATTSDGSRSPGSRPMPATPSRVASAGRSGPSTPLGRRRPCVWAPRPGASRASRSATRVARPRHERGRPRPRMGHHRRRAAAGRAGGRGRGVHGVRRPAATLVHRRRPGWPDCRVRPADRRAAGDLPVGRGRRRRVGGQPGWTRVAVAAGYDLAVREWSTADSIAPPHVQGRNGPRRDPRLYRGLASPWPPAAMTGSPGPWT